MKCCDALRELADNPQLLADLSHIPSHCFAANRNVDRERDTKAGRVVKGWDAKRIRAIVQCFHSGKARCVYTTIVR